jgi:hypothetical protein
MIDCMTLLRRNPMRLRIAGAACALSCALLACAGMAVAAPLAPADVQSTFFNGQPFTSSTPQNIKFTMVFTADGKMTRKPLGKGGAKGARRSPSLVHGQIVDSRVLARQRIGRVP